MNPHNLSFEDYLEGLYGRYENPCDLEDEDEEEKDRRLKEEAEERKFEERRDDGY